MPCDEMRDASGNLIGFKCSRGQRNCTYCGKPATKLCDGPGRHPRITCDVPMCAACATPGGKNIDYCRAHAGLTRVRK